jgi:peptide-methionine (S)-S-oxide reductase
MQKHFAYIFIIKFINILSMKTNQLPIIKNIDFNFSFYIFLIIFLNTIIACNGEIQQKKMEINQESNLSVSNLDTATFGGGCFWCTEAVFQNLNGVKSVVSGYTGGQSLNPSYKDICTGNTGHAEVIRITFDPKLIDFSVLLEVFWATHDPTTLNRQGNDIGTQYRSVIFYHNPSQKNEAERQKKMLNEKNVYGKLVVTEISEAKEFYPAEAYHQNYYNNNPNQPYCAYSIPPKLDKLKKLFSQHIK